MDLAGRRFLVIGGAGFIGSHVVDELLRKSVAKVLVYDSFIRGSRENLANALKDDRVTIVEGKPKVSNLDRLKRAMAAVDGVFNLVAIGILACDQCPEKAIKINIEGNWNVFSTALSCGVKKIVHSSSASVYGDAVQEKMDEEHPYNNQTLYGATKIANEHILKACAAKSDLKWAALRYFNVYGPRQDYRGAYISVLHRILDRLNEGKPPVLFGDGSQTLDFVHVSDVARANVLAMEADSENGYFNVCSGKGTTLKEVADLLMQLTGTAYLEPEYRIATTGTSLVSRRIGNPDKAQADLNFAVTVSLADGLRSLIEWRKVNDARLLQLQRHDMPLPAITSRPAVRRRAAAPVRFRRFAREAEG